MRCVGFSRWQIYAFTALLLVAGCSPTKNLMDGERLLTRVEVRVLSDQPESPGMYEEVLRQQANGRFLGLRLPLRLYLLVSPEALARSLERRASKGRTEGGFRWWLSNRMGEAPVIYDAYLVDRSRQNVLSLARRRGYLDATCAVHEKPSGDDRMAIEFDLTLGKPWIIEEWQWDVVGSGVELVEKKAGFPELLGARLDVTELERIRTEVAERLRQSGFPTVQTPHVVFNVDSSTHHLDHTVKVVGQVLPLDWDEAGQPIPHRPARFGSVQWTCVGDSPRDTACLDEDLVEFMIALDSGMRFNESALQETYRRLTKLPSVGRVEIPGSLRSGGGSFDEYDIDVNLHLLPRFGFSSAMEMVRSDARYGPLVKFAWNDRNVSGRGDTWGAELSGGLLSTSPFSYNSDNLIPNSGTWSVDLHYSTAGIPPLSLSRLRPSNQARTSVAMNWMREIRPEYVREAFGFNYAFDFIENPARRSKVAIVPLEARISDIEVKPEFEEWLMSQSNPVLSARFADYTSLLSRVEWKSDWGRNDRAHGVVRAGVEWTGVGLDWWNRSRDPGNEQAVFTIGGIPYTHYVRGEGEWTCGTGERFSSRASWNGRFKAGGAVTGKNSEVIPFDRAFYAGGANGIRGWSVRDLGPGFAGSDASELGVVAGVGDVQIEGSLEYRRNLTDALELAWFSDVGNVWLLPHDGANPLAELRPHSLAWGTGVGIRMDFEFFLLRVDGALRMHDPSRPDGLRWLGGGGSLGRIHLAIGQAF